MKYFVIIIGILISSLASAAYKDTGNVKVQLISAWASEGGILLQTNPQHSIEGLSCESSYWLKLNVDQPGYSAIVSMLLSAQATQRPITVRAVDDQGTDFRGPARRDALDGRARGFPGVAVCRVHHRRCVICGRRMDRRLMG